MILNIFILILAIEIIAGFDTIPPVKCQHQPGRRLWCSRDGVPLDPRLYSGPRYPGHPDDPEWPKPPVYFGPFFPIPPVKCFRASDPDGPGEVNVKYGPFFPIPPVKCGPFVPIPPVKCGANGEPIGDPPMYPNPDYPIW